MKILLIKPDALGDQLIVAGLVQSLQRLRPDARIVWHVRAGSEAFAPLVGADIFTPDLAQPPAAEAARLSAHPARLLVLPYPLSAHEAWSEDLRRRFLWWRDFLRATTWDATLCAVVNRTWIAEATASLAAAPIRLGFTANAARQPITNDAHAVVPPDGPPFTATVAPSFTTPEAEQLQSLLALLEPRLADPRPAPLLDLAAFQPTASQLSALNSQLPSFADHPPSTLHHLPSSDSASDLPLSTLNSHLSTSVLLTPGVGGDSRRAWPLTNFLQLAAGLRARGLPVVWIEGPGDAPYFAAFPADNTDPRLRFGPADLPALVATLRSARLLICHDTAYAHLAAAVGVPTVALYGAGQDARFHPRGEKVKVVQSQIACGGCQWHCLYDRLLCVADLPVSAITSAVDAVLTHADFAPSFIPLSTPFAHAPEGEAVALKRRLQDQILTLDADRFARLQIINELAPRPVATAPTSIPPGSPPPSDPQPSTLNPQLPAPSAPSLNSQPSALNSDKATAAPAGAGAAVALSVIIPMGRPERAAATLASLAAQKPSPTNWEIVLVGVGAESVARAHPQLPIIPVNLTANVLPPRTRCLGVERATGGWYLFVDDDVEIAPNLFAAFATLRDTYPTSGSASSVPTSASASDPSSSTSTSTGAAAAPSAPVGAIGPRLPGKSGRFFERVTDLSNFWAQQGGAPEDRDWLYSAAIFVSAEAYRKSGGFNPELPNGEDVDLTRRIVGAGYRLRYEPALAAYHNHQRDTLVRMLRYFWRNGNAARYFFAGHGSACCFSVRTVLVKTWTDLQMNRAFRRRFGERLGLIAPWVLLNYFIVESSLEYHYQSYLREVRLYETLPATTPSDRTYVRAMRSLASGHWFTGRLRYAAAMVLDLANPVRR